MHSILLIGLGRFGRYTAAGLNRLNQEVMAVDKNEERVNKVLNYVTDGQIGDATNEEFLKSLGVDNYDTCIVAIGDDFLSSLIVTSNLKELGAKHVIARAAGKSQEKFLLHNGADEVVFPEKQLAHWTAMHCAYEGLSDYIELENGYSILEAPVPAAWEGKTIGELEVRGRWNINVLGLKHDGVMHMQIDAGTVVNPGDRVMALGLEKDLMDCLRIKK